MSCIIAGMSDERVTTSLRKGVLVVKIFDSNRRKTVKMHVINYANIFASKEQKKNVREHVKGDKVNDKLSRNKTRFKDYSNVTIHMSQIVRIEVEVIKKAKTNI